VSNTVSVTQADNSVVVIESDNTVTVTQVSNAVTVTSPGPVGPAPPTMTYTVNGGTTGTQPTFSGDPLFTAQYVRVGDLVHFEVQVDFDNITSFGTGQYFVTLPFPVAQGIMFRNGCLHDIDTGREYHISGHAYPGSNDVLLFTTDIVGQNVYDFPFEQGEPVTLSTEDNFHISGAYIAVPAT
jgi:hypothetical protein